VIIVMAHHATKAEIDQDGDPIALVKGLLKACR